MRWRWRHLDTLSLRLTGFYVLASAPLAVLAYAVAPTLLVLAFWAAGLFMTYVGCALTILRPLHRLYLQVGQWRTGELLQQDMDSAGERWPARDIRRLALVFRRATLLLRRQEARLVAATDQQE